MIAITSLLKILNKPALLNWSNKIGLEGVSLKDYRKKSTSDGTNKHSLVENYLLNGVDFDESDKLNKCIDGYSIIAVENSFNNGFITCKTDLILEKNNKIIIVDFKSTDRIYLEQKIQLSTYKEIFGADQIAIINFKEWKLKTINIDTAKYFEIAKRLYQINELLIELNEGL